VRHRTRKLTALIATVVCLLLIPTLLVAGGATHTITFENDPPGLKPNGWQSADSDVTFFTDSQGADLEVSDWWHQSHGQALGVFHDDPSYLIMDFGVPMRSISLAFGNDDPGWSNPGDEAVLTVFDGASQVGQEKVVMNRNDDMDQTISYSGACFDKATFFYDVTAWAPGLIEIVDDIVLEECLIEVALDIKPGSDPNSINLRSKGVVPVAVLTTDEFDATTVDPATVSFAGAAPLRWTTEDVDCDGDLDLLFHFKTQELALTPESTDATLTGATFDGRSIQGIDAVNIVPRSKG
jgi:hypothetical protein